MSQGPTGHRPGGLTALAVLNFIFGGFNALAVLGLFLLIGLVNAGTRVQAEVTGTNAPPVPIMGLLYVAILMTAIAAVLLITSGVGYLGQKRFIGKTLGTVYGLLGIVSTLVSFIATKTFGIGDIINLIYPVLTLALLNTVFKDDFPNP